MKLQSMTDYVLEQEKVCRFKDHCEFAYSVIKYANFLKQPLTLEMFVACDEDGNVLDDKEWKQFKGSIYDLELLILKFKKAKSKVLFEGFKYNIAGVIYNNDGKYDCRFDEESLDNGTIEYLVKYNLTLTDNAIKQLGL